jgi:hypothetical protein
MSGPRKLCGTRRARKPTRSAQDERAAAAIDTALQSVHMISSGEVRQPTLRYREAQRSAKPYVIRMTR